MKVNIGPFKTWVGPYQISTKFDWLIGEDRADKLGDWLSNTWVNDFCTWIHSKRKRKINIHIDNYDVWSADNTLALIIHPVLVKLRESKHGSPYCDDEDVPYDLRLSNEKDGDDIHHDRWAWVLGEMIWAFEQHKTDDWESQFHTGATYGPDQPEVIDKEGLKNHHTRMKNGLRLFAKYYENLWD